MNKCECTLFISVQERGVGKLGAGEKNPGTEIGNFNF